MIYVLINEADLYSYHCKIIAISSDLNKLNKTSSLIDFRLISHFQPDHMLPSGNQCE